MRGLLNAFALSGHWEMALIGFVVLLVFAGISHSLSNKN